MSLIFEKSVKGRRGFRYPSSDVGIKAVVLAQYSRGESAPLPEVSELDAVRHYTLLSQKNFYFITHPQKSK